MKTHTHTFHYVAHNMLAYATMNKPMQVSPSPWYPLLQTQVKDPGVLVHTAFSSQGDCDCSTHSLISKGVVRTHYFAGRLQCLVILGSPHSAEVLTCTSEPISTVSCIAGTSEGPRSVDAVSIVVTWKRHLTFMNI